VEETRTAYRELVAAGLMMPLHSFVGGRESLYRLTDEAKMRKDEANPIHQFSSLSCISCFSWLPDLDGFVDETTEPQRHDRGGVMELKDEREVEVTREKLRSLEARYQVVGQDPAEDAHIQALTLRSLTRMINPMKEEIARFESGRSSRAAQSPVTVPTQGT